MEQSISTSSGGGVPALEALNLSKFYGSTRALDGVSFSVRKGEVFGLLGPNGAGKSTCMKIFAGILKPSGGSARVMGVDVVKQPVEAKRLLGFLPEFPTLFDNLTGREFLTLVGLLRGMSRDEVDERVGGFAGVLDLEGALDRLLGTYSKGMRQKISFVAAVLSSPPVLILDEPTSGLDPRFARYIKDMIKNLAAGGTTVLLSTHITVVAEELCDRIAIINRGRIVVEGTPAEVVEKTGTETLEEAFIRCVTLPPGSSGCPEEG